MLGTQPVLRSTDTGPAGERPAHAAASRALSAPLGSRWATEAKAHPPLSPTPTNAGPCQPGQVPSPAADSRSPRFFREEPGGGYLSPTSGHAGRPQLEATAPQPPAARPASQAIRWAAKWTPGASGPAHLRQTGRTPPERLRSQPPRGRSEGRELFRCRPRGRAWPGAHLSPLQGAARGLRALLRPPRRKSPS